MGSVKSCVQTLIFALFSTALLAQPERGRGPNFMRMHPVLAGLDADRDGVVTTQERAAAPQLLRSLDTNRDGVISADEVRPSFGGPGGRGRGGAEQARSNPSDMVDTLFAFDRNGDGVLEKEEVPERMQGLFARGDADHNGKLTRDELTKLAAAPAAGGGGRGGPPRDPVMTVLDADSDGGLSAEEVAGSGAALAKLDRNQDGRITEDEVRPQFGPGGPGGRRRDPAEMAAHMMEEWDGNGDGKLSKNELPERMQARFSEADGDHDGSLSKSELTALFAAQSPEGRR